MNKFRLVGLLVVALLFSEPVQAQEILYSSYEKFDFRSGDFSVIGKIGDRVYTYRGSSEGFYLDAFDDNMEKKATIVLDFFPKKVYKTRFVASGNQIVTIYQGLEENRVVQYVALLDDKGRLVKGPLVINEAKAGLLGINRDYFQVAHSEDKKYLLVYEADVRGDGVEFNGTLLDDQLNKISKISTSYTADNTLASGDVHLGNDGTLYLPVYTPIGSKGYADRVWLLTMQVGEQKFAPYEMPLNDLYAANTYMKLDNMNRRIYVGGFYSDKKNGHYEGVLYTYFDMVTKTYENRKSLAFDDRLRTATGERNKKKAFNNFMVRNLIVKNDGGFVMISEDFYVSTRNNYAGPGFGYYSWYYGPMMASSVREYHYDDILAISYDAAGNRQWHTFIRKDQYSQEDGGLFSSYALVNTGGAIGFLFNDFNANRSRIQLASMDGAGQLVMKSLSTGASDPDWLPRSGKQISAREIVVPCLSKRQICFAKVIF